MKQLRRVALLRGFALPFADDILGALGDITVHAQFPRMTKRWGAAMSVAMTNCGEAARLSDRGGYRYDRIDPETGRAMAGMPLYFSPLATTNSSVKMALPPVIEPRHSDGAYPILLGLLLGPAANAAHW